MESYLQSSNNHHNQNQFMTTSQHSLLIHSIDTGGMTQQQQHQKGTIQQRTNSKNVFNNQVTGSGGGPHAMNTESRNHLHTADINQNKTSISNLVPSLQAMVVPPAMIVGQTFGTQLIRKTNDNHHFTSTNNQLSQQK